MDRSTIPSDVYALLRRHEGERLKPYDDQTGKGLSSGTCLVGKLTIGVGRNLSDRGISAAESALLLQHDVADHWSELIAALPWIESLTEGRRVVLLDMAFNLGIPTLLTFKRTLASIREGAYARAAVEMLQSAWADQVGARALRLAEMMRTGKVAPA